MFGCSKAWYAQKSDFIKPKEQEPQSQKPMDNKPLPSKSKHKGTGNFFKRIYKSLTENFFRRVKNAFFQTYLAKRTLLIYPPHILLFISVMLGQGLREFMISEVLDIGHKEEVIMLLKI